jgi:hypothetical protein
MSNERFAMSNLQTVIFYELSNCLFHQSIYKRMKLSNGGKSDHRCLRYSNEILKRIVERKNGDKDERYFFIAYRNKCAKIE